MMMMTMMMVMMVMMMMVMMMVMMMMMMVMFSAQCRKVLILHRFLKLQTEKYLFTVGFHFLKPEE